MSKILFSILVILVAPGILAANNRDYLFVGAINTGTDIVFHEENVSPNIGLQFELMSPNEKTSYGVNIRVFFNYSTNLVVSFPFSWYAGEDWLFWGAPGFSSTNQDLYQYTGASREYPPGVIDESNRMQFFMQFGMGWRGWKFQDLPQFQITPCIGADLFKGIYLNMFIGVNFSYNFSK